MPFDKNQSSVDEIQKSAYPENSIGRQELFPLLSALVKSPHMNIRVKRIDRINPGKFSTVTRASGALVMIRDVESGVAEVISDLRDVQHFELDKDFQNFKANTVYEVVDVHRGAAGF